MTSLTLKNIPEELLRMLREAAEQDRRSLTQEIIHLLNTAIQRRNAPPASPVTGAEAQVAAWRKLAGKWESDVDRATETERIMKRRSRGREIEF